MTATWPAVRVLVLVLVLSVVVLLGQLVCPVILFQLVVGLVSGVPAASDPSFGHVNQLRSRCARDCAASVLAGWMRRPMA